LHLFAEASELARPVFALAGIALLHRSDFAIGPETASVAIHSYALENGLSSDHTRKASPITP